MLYSMLQNNQAMTMMLVPVPVRKLCAVKLRVNCYEHCVNTV